MQFQADLLNAPMFNMSMEEVSMLGAAFLAGLEVVIF